MTAEKGETGSSIEQPASFNSSESTQESGGFPLTSTDESLSSFIDTFRQNTGTVMTDVQKEYPAELKVQKENEEWKISEIGFGSIPVK